MRRHEKKSTKKAKEYGVHSQVQSARGQVFPSCGMDIHLFGHNYANKIIA
jgi:hypothetical protein